MPGVNAVITDLLKMFFRDMLYQAADKFQNRDGFCYKFFVLMAAVMEGYIFTVITVNAGCGNDRPAKVTANIFSGFVWVAFVWPGIDIKAVFVVFAAGRFYFFESVADLCFHFIEQGGLKESTQQLIVEIGLFTTQPAAANAAFRN